MANPNTQILCGLKATRDDNLDQSIGRPAGKSLDQASAVISHFAPARFHTVRYLP